MSQAPPPPPYQQRIIIQHVGGESNGLGTAGFVISLVGLLLTCGLLSPIGLILSIAGLFKPPRGLAIAGFIIGLIGSVGFAAFGLGFLLLLIGFGAAAKAAGQVAQTTAAIQQASSAVAAYRAEHKALPDDAEGQRLVAGSLDAWKHPLTYQKVDDKTFEIASAGLDGKPSTPDDIRRRFPNEADDEGEGDAADEKNADGKKADGEEAAAPKAASDEPPPAKTTPP
ncbi:MAG TPA: DUF4190 domain-containing protein [Isosphaeraceae bacterium]|jgi:hypothetical protein|nr:DUF4190 domain-containing protein [Isosphaeraceae bacterium]